MSHVTKTCTCVTSHYQYEYTEKGSFARGYPREHRVLPMTVARRRSVIFFFYFFYYYSFLHFILFSPTKVPATIISPGRRASDPREMMPGWRPYDLAHAGESPSKWLRVSTTHYCPVKGTAGKYTGCHRINYDAYTRGIKLQIFAWRSRIAIHLNVSWIEQLTRKIVYYSHRYESSGGGYF